MSDFKGRRFQCRILLDRQNVDFEGRTKMFVSLFQIRRQHIFDPFHECADSARQIAPMCYDEGHGERRRRKSGMISTSVPLSKYRPIPKSGA